MLKEIQLDYTVNTLVKLAKDQYGDNAAEYLAGALESVISYNQMQTLIDNLKTQVNA